MDFGNELIETILILKSVVNENRFSRIYIYSKWKDECEYECKMNRIFVKRFESNGVLKLNRSNMNKLNK